MSFYISKIFWLIFNPFNIFIFISLFSVFLYFINKRRFSLFIFLINFIFVSLISFFPVGSFLIYNIEKEYHENTKIPEKLDGILILGGATNPLLFKEYNQISLNGAAERLVESAMMIKKFQKIKVIFSSGSGIVNRPDLSHSKVAKSFYKKMGVEINKIIFEDNSRNTYENIIFSKKIAKPKTNENWLLITSAYHMKRALLIADKNNWKLTPYAVDFKNLKNFRFTPNLKLLTNLNLFQLGFHEWSGLISYYIMGRTNKIF